MNNIPWVTIYFNHELWRVFMKHAIPVNSYDMKSAGMVEYKDKSHDLLKSCEKKSKLITLNVGKVMKSFFLN